MYASHSSFRIAQEEKRWQHFCAPKFEKSLMPNPSVKGTSSGKPQAAPYVERSASS